MAVPFQDGFPQFLDNSGNPLSAGKLYTYAAGTTTPLASYTTRAGTTPNANPVILDSAGRANIWLSGGISYRLILKDSTDVTIRDIDNLILLSDTPSASVTSTVTSTTASVGQTAFTVPTYTTGVNAVVVFVDGVMTRGFTETNQTTVTLTDAAEGSEEVVIIAGTMAATGVDPAQISYQYDATGTTARAINEKLDEVLSVLDCGSPARDGSNAADTTTAFLTAIDIAEALIAGGSHSVTIDIPDGKYLLNETLVISTSNIRLRGRGKGVTWLTRATDYGDTIRFSGNDATGATINRIGLEGVTLESTALITTDSAHVTVNGAAIVDLHDIEVLQGFKGFLFKGMTAAHISGIYLVFTNLYGGSVTNREYMRFSAAAATYAHPHCGDVHLDDINLRGNIGSEAAQYGVHILGADGLWFTNFHIGNTTASNILFSNSVSGDGGNINLVSFDTGMSDEGTGYGLAFSGSTNTIAEGIDFTNVRFKGGANATIGIIASTGCAFHDVSFTDCDVYQYDQHGIYIQSTTFTGCTLEDCRSRENGLGTSNTYSGLICDSGVTDLHVRGGVYGRLATSNGTSAHVRGITFAGTASGCSVIDADLGGNVTTGISMPTTGVRFRAHPMQHGSYAVASATTLVVPAEYDRATVSGSTSITSIQATYDGHLLELVFSSTAQLTDGSNIKAAGNFTGGADRVWRGRCDGTNWLEISRSTN